jgi:hypothetical protein
MNWILITLELYAVGCVLLLMPLMAVNRHCNGSMLSTDTVLLAILWPVVFLAVLLWLGAYSFLGYFNGRNRPQGEL